ncbi:CoA transferase [Arthrobacter sp. C152]
MRAADAASPRRWWGGPLDVEGLGLESVGAAAGALNLYTGSPGRFSTTPALMAAAFDSFGHLRIGGRAPQGFAPLSGFRRTGDGWIRLHANYPHHEKRLLRALGATTPAGAEAALGTMTSLEAEAAIQGEGGIAAAVRTRSEWLSSDMGKAAAAGPWVARDGGGTPGWGLRDFAAAAAPAAAAAEAEAAAGHAAEGAAGAGGSPDLPLEGLRVLDLTRVIAGPVATRLLAALGADVLRIDPPALPEIVDQFVDTAFGKRSAEADLGSPANRNRLRELLADADVVVTGYRPAALDRFGLNPLELPATHPRLVVVTLDSWGWAGPWSGLRGFDSIVQAASGIAHLYGTEDDDGGWRPGALPVQALDHATGYGVAAAAVLLLAERRQTGRGGAARLSLARTAEELFSLAPDIPAPNTAAPAKLPAPGYRTIESSYGQLRYVPPPLLVSGRTLDYASAPPPYGSSRLAWT